MGDLIGIGHFKGTKFKEVVKYDRELYNKTGVIRLNANYRKGLVFEHQVRDWLTKRGWIVMRSAGSKTAVDLVGVRENHTILVQCKYGTKPALAERKNMSILEEQTGSNIQVLLAYRPKYGRKIDWFTMRAEGELTKVNI